MPADGTEGGGCSAGGGARGGVYRSAVCLLFRRSAANRGPGVYRSQCGDEGTPSGRAGGWRGGLVRLGEARRGRSVCKKNSAIWLLRDLEKHTCHFLVSEGKEARSQKWQFSYKAEYSCSSINSNGRRLRPTIRTHLPWNHSCCSSRGKKPRRVLFFSRTKKMTISFTCRFVGTLSTTCEQTNKIKLKVMLNSPVLPQLLFLGIPATKVKASGECGANWSGGRSAFNINDERRAYICMF